MNVEKVSLPTPFFIPAFRSSVCKGWQRYCQILLDIALLESDGRVVKAKEAACTVVSHRPELEEEFQHIPSQYSQEFF